MAIEEITVKPRNKTGKGASGRLRREGLVPAVVYGLGIDAASVTVEPKLIQKIVHSESGLNAVLLLKMDGSDQMRHVMIKDLTKHPVSGRIEHIDFLRIDMDKVITSEVPIILDGTPAGVKMGGLLTIVRHELEIECLATDLPSSIHVDVSELELGDSLRIGDIPKPKGVTFLEDDERPIALVQAPEAEPEEEEEDLDVDVPVVGETPESDEGDEEK